jgi:hypothetical protein
MTSISFRSLVAAASVGMLLAAASPVLCADASGESCPLLVPLGEVKAEIAEITLVTEYDTAQGKWQLSSENRPKFRYAVVTVKFEKPAGKALEVAAADLTLHYRCSSGKVDVAQCSSISAINMTLSEDRPLESTKTGQPGWMKKRTGLRATQGTVVYMDVAFHMIELDISEAWLVVGQPATPKPFRFKASGAASE